MNVELHCHLDGVGPSDRHPDLAQVLVSVPPPEEAVDIDPRGEALADYISRTMELGATASAPAIPVKEFSSGGSSLPHR